MKTSFIILLILALNVSFAASDPAQTTTLPTNTQAPSDDSNSRPSVSEDDRDLWTQEEQEEEESDEPKEGLHFPKEDHFGGEFSEPEEGRAQIPREELPPMEGRLRRGAMLPNGEERPPRGQDKPPRDQRMPPKGERSDEPNEDHFGGEQLISEEGKPELPKEELPPMEGRHGRGGMPPNGEERPPRGQGKPPRDQRMPPNGEERPPRGQGKPQRDQTMPPKPQDHREGSSNFRGSKQGKH